MKYFVELSGVTPIIPLGRLHPIPEGEDYFQDIVGPGDLHLLDSWQDSHGYVVEL